MAEPTPSPKKVLVLHVEVEGFWADDLDEAAEMYGYEPGDPKGGAVVVTEEWMRETVGLTLVGIPGDKCMSDDFEVHAYTARIVGAEARDRG